MAESEKDREDLSTRDKFLSLSLESTRKSYYPQLQTHLEVVKESERRLELLIDNLPARISYVDLDERYVFVNREYERALGLSREAIVGKRVESILGQENYRQVKQHIQDVLRGTSVRFETSFASQEGPVQWIQVNYVPDLDPKRGVRGFYDLTLDLTEKKRTEEAIRESETFLNALLDSIPIPVFYKDRNGRYLRFNKAYEKYIGKTREDVLGKTAFDIYPRELAEHYQARDRELFEEGGVLQYDTQIKNAQGLLRDVILNKAVFTDRQGSVIGLIGAILDITERKRAEEALRMVAEIGVASGEEIFPLLVRHLALSQDVCCALLARVEPEDPSAAQTLAVWHEGKTIPSFQFRLDENPWKGILTYDPNFYPNGIGSLFPQNRLLRDMGVESLLGVPLRDTDKRLLGILAILDNRPMEEDSSSLTLLQSFGARAVAEIRRLQAEVERARMEEQYRHAQKMEAIGQLTGGIAHDFNNLLQVINGATDLALADLETGHPARALLLEATKAGERAARLVKQLLLFSRRQIMRAEFLDLNEAVADLLKMLGRVIGEHVQLQWHPGAKVGAIHADRGMIEQALMNLCVNARDAMPEGGALTIETREATLDEDYCAIRSWATPGRYAVLSVSDTGCGMTPEVLEHIFEPFFTTKERDKGTGLGLATVYGIVKQHNGLIDVSSELCRGTVFSLYWPVSEIGKQSTNSAAESPVPGGKETILLAEDDEMVRWLAKRILEQAGYTVLMAENGEEAVALYQQYGDRIALAVMDVVMPKMSGYEACRRMAALRPGLRVLFASGYSEKVIHADILGNERFPLIQKPFTRAALLRAIRETLDRPAQGPRSAASDPR